MNDDRSTAEPAARWADARAMLRLLAVDPAGLCGVHVRARPGPARDRFLALAEDLSEPGAPWRKLPPNVTDDRLLGGLDLARTLKMGRPVAERGLIAETDGGTLVAAMAERVSPGLAARLARVLDDGEIVIERDGLTFRTRARVAVIAIDEGIADDETIPAALADRLAFQVRLEGLRPTSDDGTDDERGVIRVAQGRLPDVRLSDELLEALAKAALALGIVSVRTLLLTARAARAAAALAGRTEADETDAALAGRLVLAPRARHLPAPPESAPDDPADAPDPERGDTPNPADSDPGQQADEPQTLEDVVLAAAATALPPGLLALAAMGDRRGGAAPGTAGDLAKSNSRGRPSGTMRGDPRTGKRLSLVATLRAAAPWQPIRRRGQDGGRVIVQAEDFRVRRLKQPTETTAIFLVDASGSQALHRLAEAKGAIELLLADCYVRRDRVALVAFRGRSADLLLPPTRSLARVKRSLAGLPGGGGTPLATALDAGALLADQVRRKGQTPVLVVLTDGRANIARNGASGRPEATADALAASRTLRTQGVRSVLIDTSPRPQDLARRIAQEMNAAYVPLPQAGAEAVSAAVRMGMDQAARSQAS